MPIVHEQGMAKVPLTLFRAYVEAIKAETGLDYTSIARRAKLSPSTITRPMNDSAYAKDISPTTLGKLFRTFGIPMGEQLASHMPSHDRIMGGRHESGLPRVHTSVLDVRTAGRDNALIPIKVPVSKDLPVVGGARGGGNTMIFDQNAPIDWVQRPPQLIGVSEAFAVYVVGDSMTPKYKAGDCLWCHPNLPLQSGRCVVIEFTDGTAIVKQLLAADDRRLRVREYYPETRDFDVMRTEIRQAVMVVGSWEA